MNELHFNNQQIAGMILRYYEKYEEKKVAVQIHCGKVVGQGKYVPAMGTVCFDVYEMVWKGGERIKQSIPVDDDDLKRMVGKVLEEAEFRADDIGYDVDVNDPTRFIGIKVTGEKSKEPEKSL